MSYSMWCVLIIVVYLACYVWVQTRRYQAQLSWRASLQAGKITLAEYQYYKQQRPNIHLCSLRAFLWVVGTLFYIAAAWYVFYYHVI